MWSIIMCKLTRRSDNNWNNVLCFCTVETLTDLSLSVYIKSLFILCTIISKETLNLSNQGSVKCKEKLYKKEAEIYIDINFCCKPQ